MYWQASQTLQFFKIKDCILEIFIISTLVFINEITMIPLKYISKFLQLDVDLLPLQRLMHQLL